MLANHMQSIYIYGQLIVVLFIDMLYIWMVWVIRMQAIPFHLLTLRLHVVAPASSGPFSIYGIAVGREGHLAFRIIVSKS